MRLAATSIPSHYWSSPIHPLVLLHPLIITHLHISISQQTNHCCTQCSHRRRHHHQTPQSHRGVPLRRCVEYDIKRRSRGGAHLKPSEASPAHIICITHPLLCSCKSSSLTPPTTYSCDQLECRHHRKTQHALHATTPLEPASYSQISPREPLRERATTMGR